MSLFRDATRWLVRAIALFAILAVIGLVSVFVLSEAYLRDVAPPPAFSAVIPTDSTSIAYGRHLTRTRGCFGCHGQQLEGQVFDYWPWVKRAVAPNLAAFAKAHEPATLEAAIRHGIGHDGRALWSMPSYNFVHLPDSAVAAMIAFLKSAEVEEHELAEPAFGLRTRWWMARRTEMHMQDWAERVPGMVVGSDEQDNIRRGERLAMTTCNECHGLDLRGSTAEMDISPPDLAIVAAYPWDDFVKLMRTGIPIGGRDLGLMKVVAQDRFAHFTEQEVEDLYAFLRTLPNRPVASDVFWRPEAE